MKKINPSPKEFTKEISRELAKLDKSTFYEKYGVFMLKSQIIELELKNILIRKFKYNEDKLEKMTLGTIIKELAEKGMRLDFVSSLHRLLEFRNYFAHEFLIDDFITVKITNKRMFKSESSLFRALHAVEETLQVYLWLKKNNILTFRKNKNAGKKLLVFVEGTILCHRNAVGNTKAEIADQIKNKDESIFQYDAYAPISQAVGRLRALSYQGIKIFYITSLKKERDVQALEKSLNDWEFPKGYLYFRKKGENYKETIDRISPDIILENNHKNTGNISEMVYPNIKESSKIKIKSVVVEEFTGIDSVKI